MYTAAALLDIHARTQRSLARLIEHCAGFEPSELTRELAGFGYPTLAAQLDHIVGAERYWLAVLHGQTDWGAEEPVPSSADVLSARRASVAAATRAYLETTSDAALNTPGEYTTWGGRRATLLPARVLLRTQTHVFQHQGQVAAMCRLLGRPIPAGLDFPLD